MTVHKKVTKSGGITIPRMMRQETGILEGMAVDVVTDENGIHIIKHVPACFHCGTVDDIVSCHGLEICRGCMQKIWEAFSHG